MELNYAYDDIHYIRIATKAELGELTDVELLERIVKTPYAENMNNIAIGFPAYDIASSLLKEMRVPSAKQRNALENVYIYHVS